MNAPTLVRFPDRHRAYRFVSELRRVSDLERWVDLRVHELGDELGGEMVVELPEQPEPAIDALQLAERHGGRRAADRAELEHLRQLIARAASIQHETRARLAASRDAVADARETLARVRADRARESPTDE